MMAAEKYPTLSYSLRVYFVLITFVSSLESETSSRESPALFAGIKACKEKLLEFFDKSTYDSEYYYFATGEYFKNINSWVFYSLSALSTGSPLQGVPVHLGRLFDSRSILRRLG